jgi:glycosyltransferase involved in cell wall biosynthesis
MNTSTPPLRICYFGTYRDTYVRNRLMIERLRLNGCEVVECHATLWRGFDDRDQVAKGGWMDPRFLSRAVSAYLRLIWRYTKVGHYDILIVGYPGQPDIPLARLLTWLVRKPLVWDVLMSIYLIALERGVDRRSPVSIRLLRMVERIACRLPDVLIIDTEVYAQWYTQNYGVSRDRIRLLPLGADDRVFKPQPPVNGIGEEFCCLYYGTYIPNHGVKYIVEAARLTAAEDRSISFEMIGNGPDLEACKELAREYGLTNIHFIEWLDIPALVEHIARADAILGTFGNTPQANMTMQNKIHEGLAMAKAVINGDSPVMRQTLRHGEEIYLVPREDACSLADAIIALRIDPVLRDRIARQGHQYYQEHLSFDRIGMLLKKYLLQLREGK